MDSIFLKMYFFNKRIDKSELKKFITWSFRKYGTAKASNMADKLKDLGFFYATKAGISLSLEDLRIPPSKNHLLNTTLESIFKTDERYRRGEITAVEKFQKIIDTWSEASENLKEEVIKYFKNTDPLNSIYMMAFSGARANISQVRQLVGMRGLMSDPQGQIIDLPIYSNFREGLTVTDYFISSYGARKGLVDTALRTADSGYLTRRLVDVAQDIIIRDYDCKTKQGILIEEMFDNQKVLIDLKQSLLGRILAENIVDLISNEIIAESGQSIDPELSDRIINLKYRNVLIRSPLTCTSLRSICQLCYGWNLAHGKMVDLGEAVGIIAAQSIGEPGTQLTMRTFHTGGVFTGQLAKNIISPCNGYLFYPDVLNASKIRTKHGNYGMLLNVDHQIKILTIDDQEYFINLLKGSLILVQNKTYIYKDQIIAEYFLDNRLSTERAQKTVVADFSGSIHFQSFANNEKLIKNTLTHNIKNNLVIWVLAGKVYNIPNNIILMVNENQQVVKNTLLAKTELKTHDSGLVYLVENSINVTKLLLVTSSKLYTNIYVYLHYYQDYKKYILEVNKKEKFVLRCKPNSRIVDQQIIGDMLSDAYKTKTGGIIKYLDLSITVKYNKDLNKDLYEINNSGYILWISEETHIINKDISLLLINEGQFIEIGTEIVYNTFASNSGIVEILEKDGIVKEVIIKPGKLYNLPSNFEIGDIGKYRGFLRPGENIFSIRTKKLVYWEYINIFEKKFILLRSVIVYSVPKKELSFNYSDHSFNTNILNLKLIRRTFFKDGERIKSVAGVNLVTTHLLLNVESKEKYFKLYIQLENLKKSISEKPLFLLKFITADFLFIKNSYFDHYNDMYTKTKILIKDNQYVKANSVIAQTDIFSSIQGYVFYVNNIKASNSRMLIVSNSHIVTFSVPYNQTIKVKINQWIYAGDYIAGNIISNYSGKIISINNNQINLRIGQPYLISSGSFLHISNNNLIQRGENIATLIFERSKTGDIVQGLPRIEEILEARKKTDTILNSHIFLDSKFKFYLNEGLSIDDATKLSFIETQLLLIKEVQLVYQSQGVDISDKHIEIIVKQMTSKVKIDNGGDTDYLPGELVDLQKIEFINNSLKVIKKRQASYYPILLGITKASLNTDSFISAASFQETTKVLTDAAISGKLDWLRGLKENVIIGRLIPAGTGFNIHNKKDITKFSNINATNNYLLQNFNGNPFNHDFEDIIVDDRGYNNINFINN
uniref:DNA-directed RNA polymerase n=1 Tax=Halydictyon mirabile TaxID=189652 RepID=A0A4D6WTV4_9FLOR|nr:RNA polymerase b'-subunit [Halydictyon mirabile]